MKQEKISLMTRTNEIYYKYLDNVLVKSCFKIDLLRKGSDILLKKFPELQEWKRASNVLSGYVIDTDPYNRLQKDQLSLNF